MSLSWLQDSFPIQSPLGGAVLIALILGVTSGVTKLLNGLKTVSYLPGLRPAFEPLDVPGAVIPTSWWNPGIDFPYVRRAELYKTFQSETISVVPFIFGRPTLYTSDIDIIRQLVSGGPDSAWLKPTNSSLARRLSIWGVNIVVAVEETWRRHRRVIGPSFNSKSYALVWAVTTQIYHDIMSSDEWAHKDIVEINAVQTIMFKLALLVMGACGFGLPFTWNEPPTTAGQKMSLQEALRTVADNLMFAMAAPKWAYSIPHPWIKRINTAYGTLQQFMDVHIAKRKAEARSMAANGEDSTDWGRDDVFSMLVRANELEKNPKLQLSDQELIGNFFVMILAGYETTANTLAATLSLLALHEEIQNEVFEHIISVIGRDEDPTYDDYYKLDKVLAVFYEANRLFPSGSVLFREATKDTVLNISNPSCEQGGRPMAIPKGLMVLSDMVGALRNPRYFLEPDAFKPSRWYGVSPDAESFNAFGVGPRECIGKKFSSVEAVCFLSLILRDWKVEPIMQPGEGKLDWENRVFDAKVTLTLGIKPASLRFTKREKSELK